ncbi:hypothetical protein BDN67DRAFT_776363 [Paxillus ammoniavirescens]|nr:hypothetical protein BDN67DRAFT_776363 [Paxillus ammoniavirescens]
MASPGFAYCLRVSSSVSDPNNTSDGGITSRYCDHPPSCRVKTCTERTVCIFKIGVVGSDGPGPADYEGRCSSPSARDSEAALSAFNPQILTVPAACTALQQLVYDGLQGRPSHDESGWWPLFYRWRRGCFLHSRVLLHSAVLSRLEDELPSR